MKKKRRQHSAIVFHHGRSRIDSNSLWIYYQESYFTFTSGQFHGTKLWLFNHTIITIVWSHSFTAKKLTYIWNSCGRISHLLYSISTTPRANKEADASLLWAIPPKARWLRMKSVLSPEPWSVKTIVTPLPEQ